MFKVLFVYPLLNTALNNLKESSFSLQFPKANSRVINSATYFSFNWAAVS